MCAAHKKVTMQPCLSTHGHIVTCFSVSFVTLLTVVTVVDIVVEVVEEGGVGPQSWQHSSAMAASTQSAVV